MRRRVILAAAVLGGGAAAALLLLWRVRAVLAPFGLALAIAYMVAPLVDLLQRRGLARPWAIVVVYAGLVLAGVVVLLRVVPPAIADMQTLASSLPGYSSAVRTQLEHWRVHYRSANLPDGVRQALDGTIAEVERRATAQLGAVLGGVFHLAEGLFSLILAPFLAFYLLKDLEYMRDRLAAAIPPGWRSEIMTLLRAFDAVIAGFVRGQVILGVIVGTLAGLVSHLLGLRYPVLLGIFAGITELVPIVGPILGALPAVAVGLLTSPWLGLEAALAFAAIQQVENALLAPTIIGESVGLHPLAVMFAILAGGYLGGLAGLILAVPLVGILRIAWLYVCRKLTAAPQAAP